MEKHSKRLRFFARFPSLIYRTRVVAYPFYEQAQYAIDFEWAASALAGTMAGNPEDDRLLMPVLFLYRHAFELRLKIMLDKLDVMPEERGGQGRERPKRRTSTHSLRNLLSEYMLNAQSVIGSDFPRDLKEIVDELHDLDPGGVSFRYADSSNVSEVMYIDLPLMTNRLDETLRALSAVQDYVEDRAGWND